MQMGTPNSEFCISDFFESDITNSNPNMSSFLKKASKFFLGFDEGKKKHKQQEEKGGKEKEENQEECVGNEEEVEIETVNVNEENSEKGKSKLKNRGKLFVGGLNPGTTTQNLEIYFSRFGKVLDAVVVRYPKTFRSRGFGFVTFVDPANAESVLLQGNHTLDGKVIEIRPFGKKKTENRVFLGGVPQTVKETDLKEFFTRYGEVRSVDIINDKETKKQKEFAFLEFSHPEALEKCLSEGFVHIGGKRVVIRKAEPRDGSKIKDDASGPDLSQKEEDFDDEQGFCHGEDAASTVDDEIHSTSSGGQWSVFDQDPRFQKLLEDYFLSKTGSADKVNDAKTKEWNESARPQEKEVADVEKLLMDIFLNSGTVANVGEKKENLIHFSTDEETSEEGTSDGDSSSDELDDILDGTNRYLTTNDAELSKNFLRKGGEDGDLSRNLPDHFMAKGSLWCSLCQWRPSDGSKENFFAHCQTHAHRLKTQERFNLKQNQVNKPDAKSIFTATATGSKSLEKLLIGECDSEVEEKPKTKQKKEPQMNHQKQQQQQREQQEQVQLMKQQQEQQQKLSQQHQKQKQQNQPRKNVQQHQKKEQQSKGKENKDEVKTKQHKRDISNLKIHALAKAMVSIRPLSGNALHCTMCEKTIPKAQNFDTLMKNLSQHLQSRNHLNNLSATENSLKTALEENPKKEKGSYKTHDERKSREGEKGNSNARGESSVKEKFKRRRRKKNSEIAETGVGNAKKKETDKGSASCGNNFLCLYCKCRSGRARFRAHLKSKSHSDCLRGRGVSSDYFLNSRNVCPNCQVVLFGSPYDINQHYSGCLGV